MAQTPASTDTQFTQIWPVRRDHLAGGAIRHCINKKTLYGEQPAGNHGVYSVSRKRPPDAVNLLGAGTRRDFGWRKHLHLVGHRPVERTHQAMQLSRKKMAVFDAGIFLVQHQLANGLKYVRATVGASDHFA